VRSRMDDSQRAGSRAGRLPGCGGPPGGATVHHVAHRGDGDTSAASYIGARRLPLSCSTRVVYSCHAGTYHERFFWSSQISAWRAQVLALTRGGVAPTFMRCLSIP